MFLIILVALIALTLFFYFQNQRLKRMEDHHERSKERFEKLLQSLGNKKDDEPGQVNEKNEKK